MLKEWNDRDKIALGVLIAGAGILRLYLAWLDFPRLVTQIPDDAFYYFGIARNLIAGYGVTFDGVNVTNGFHPLWLALVLPCFALFGEDEVLPIRLALSLAAGFDCCAGLIAGGLVKRITRDKLAAWLAMFFYLFNPGILKESINGLETAVTVLLIAICFMWYLRIIQSRGTITLVSGLVQGILYGLVMLARTDNVIFVAMMLIATIAFQPNRRILSVGFMGSIAMVILAPWLIWNWFQFGSLFQSSGEAYPYALRAVFFANRPYSFTDDLLVGFFQWYHWTFKYIPLYYFLWQEKWNTIYYTLLIITIVLLVRHRNPFTPRWCSWIRLAFVPIGSLWLLVVVHAFVRWYPRSWYFAPLVFFITLVLGLTLAYIRLNLVARRLSMKYIVMLLLIGWGVGFSYRYIQDWGERYPWQIEMWEAAKWIRANLPSEKVGAFNAGIIGYIARHQTTNLDGVVNSQSYRAIRQKELSDWMCKQSIRFLADFPFSLKFYSIFMRDNISFRSIKAWNLAPEPAAKTHLNIYEISCK